jgi:hypothetical protein
MENWTSGPYFEKLARKIDEEWLAERERQQKMLKLLKEGKINFNGGVQLKWDIKAPGRGVTQKARRRCQGF